MFLSSALAVGHALLYIIFSPRRWQALGRYVMLAIAVVALLAGLIEHDPTSYGHVLYAQKWQEELGQIAWSISRQGTCLRHTLPTAELRLGIERHRERQATLEQLSLVVGALAILALILGIADCFRAGAHRYHILALAVGIAASVGALSLFSDLSKNVFTEANLSWLIPFISIFLASGFSRRGAFFQATFSAVCLMWMLCTPMAVQTTYLCGAGSANLRDTINMFAQSRDLIVNDSSSHMPGLEFYGRDASLRVPPEQRDINGAEAAIFLDALEHSSNPVQLGHQEIRYLLRVAAITPSWRGRRIWLLYKSNPDLRKYDITESLRENFGPDSAHEATIFDFKPAEGKLQLIYI